MPSSIGENILKQYLQLMYPHYTFVHNFRPSWLKNEKTGENLELDIYCRELNKGWEFQGIQHFRDAKQIERDKIKAKMCRALKVTLSKVTLKQLHGWLKTKQNKEGFDKLFKSIDNYIKIAKTRHNDITAKKKKPAIRVDKKFEFKSR